MNWESVGILDKQLAKNTFSLYAIFAGNALLPFVMLPYLSRVLGVHGLGTLLVIQSIVSVVAIVIDYGFTISGTRDVSIHRGDGKRLNRIVSGIIGAKLVLVGISIVCLLILVMTPLKRYVIDYGFAMAGACVGVGFNFFWYFLGIEKIAVLAGFDFLSKVLYAGAVFALVQHSGQVESVLFLQAGGFYLVVIFSFVVMKKHGIQVAINVQDTVRALQSGWSGFVFRGLSALHANAAFFFLGSLYQPAIVGYYAGAYKLSKQLVLFLTGPLWQALYPRLALRSSGGGFNSRKVALLITAMALVGTAMLILYQVFGETTALLILGNGFEPSVPMLLGLSLLVPLVFVNVALINLILAGKQETTLNVATISNIVILGVLLSLTDSAMGAVQATVIAELVFFFTLYYVYRRFLERK